MRFFLAFLLAFSIGLSTVGGTDVLVGQEAEVEPIDSSLVVVIPAECEIGELVRMEAAESNVDGITWRIMPKTPDFEVIEEGRRAFFSSRSGGEFLIIVAGAKAGVPFLHYQTLTVKGSPVPVTGLTLKISQWLKAAPNADKTKLKAMAGVFRRLATSNTTSEEMIKATGAANSAVLGSDADIAKLAPFLDKLGDELDLMVKDGTLTTRQDFTTKWLEIAAALDINARG